jgi:anaerobic selenocysteine-containing dehydrogenase
MSGHTAYRVCPICEANCGLEVTVEEERVIAIRGNENDKISLGHVCPKGVALMELRDDPDRVRTPMIRKEGKLVEASWEEAFAVIKEKFADIKSKYGSEALALYIGNATIGTTPFMVGYQMLLQCMGTQNLYTAGSMDHLPKLLTCKEMYGWEYTNPVPDIDNSDYILMIGANPMVSNGSLWLATGFRKRLKAMQARGGELEVIDPRFTETAKVADNHNFIKPGQDPYFLLGLLHVIYRDDLINPGIAASHVNGLAEIQQLAATINLAQMSENCGIEVSNIERIAHKLANTERAGIYGRVGSSTQIHGTLTSWLTEVINIITGKVDIPGGMMFPKAAAFSINTMGEPGKGQVDPTPPHRTRVSNMPAVCGELPIACLAEEITTPGEGKIRGLVTICGNPASSTPGAEQLDQALSDLDFMLSFDIYINESTRHADVILPGAPTFEKSYYGAFSVNYASRNVVRYSPALFDLQEGYLSDWDAFLQVCSLAAGGDVLGEEGLLAMENQMISAVLSPATQDPYSVAYGLDVEEAMSKLTSKRGIDRVIETGFRSGPYGDGFGKNPNGITLEKIIAEPNGLDLGPLQPRLPEILRTPSGKIELSPGEFMAEVKKLLAAKPETSEFTLIGRRQPRGQNSWGHNVNILIKGKFRCTLQMHSEDAQRLNLHEGDNVKLDSETGEIVAQLEISDDMMPGVISLPHGFGHNKEGMQLSRAMQQPGVNINNVLSNQCLDALTGNVVTNGVPVNVSPVH